MTLRKTTIIEWETTPGELRRIADELAKPVTKSVLAIPYGEICLTIHFDESKWLQEQVEGKE